MVNGYDNDYQKLKKNKRIYINFLKKVGIVDEITNNKITMIPNEFEIMEPYHKQDSLTKKALKMIPSYRVFRGTYKLLQKSQWWSPEQLKKYQLEQLKKLLDHAYKNIPYYQKIFNERGLKPKDIKDFKDLQKLPFLTKDDIRDNLENFKAKNYSHNKFEYVRTGGSTGVPFGFYYEKPGSRAKEWAFIKSLWGRVGYHFNDKCVIMRGNVIKSKDKNKFFELTFFGKWLVLSSYHMTDENLIIYIKKIREFKPKFIQAYPSAITILAKFMKENNIESFQSIKAILCGSENLYQWQRELLESVFQCRIYSWYGQAEQVALAGECETSSNYHIFPEYGYVEIIRPDGTHVQNEGEMGEIVATGFNNYAMPLIRYKTQDIAIYTKIKCSCGRNYSLLNGIEGRIQEFFISHQGNLIPLAGAHGMISKASRYIKKAQFYQEEKGYVLLKIVKDRGFTNSDSLKIINAINAKYGKDLDFKIEFVEDIPLSKAGKFIFLIQKLPIEYGAYKSDTEK